MTETPTTPASLTAPGVRSTTRVKPPHRATYRLAITAALLAARPATAQAPAELQAITQDPAIAVADPATRALAHALMAEAVPQLAARAYDQALANFLEAYARFPSPKILLHIAATLRAMGRLADAANTYQRYLTDPATEPARVAEVKQRLIDLDAQLTILTVHVAPRGSELSLDGGPFIAVGGALVTRVRPGLHLVRVHKDALARELTVNGFDGEAKEVDASLVPPEATGPAPDRIDGWLVTGTQYVTTDPTSRERAVRDVAALVPRHAERIEARPRVPDDEIDSGALAVLRIDGKGRGFAGGLGLAIARGHFEAELMVLKSDELGGYLGLRYRILTGSFRPYVALGAPGFVYDHDDPADDGSILTAKRLAIGLRTAAGIELKINRHVSVQGDVGYEHFFFVDEHFEADVLVPTLGMIGRL